MPMYVRFQTSKELQDLAYELIEKARDGGKLGKVQMKQQSTSNVVRRRLSLWLRTLHLKKF